MWFLQRAALLVYINLPKTSPRLRPKTSKMGHWRSKMELFMKTVYANFYSLNIFTKRSHHRCSTEFSSRLCWRLLKSRKSLTVTAQKSFPLRISSVNVTKSAGNCGFGHIYQRNPEWKILYFVQCLTPVVNYIVK